jgi:hypothetical protein
MCTDWNIIISMVVGDANPLATQIITTDKCMQETMEKAKTKWNFQAQELANRAKKTRNAWLTTKARIHRIKQTNNTFFHPEGTPVWKDSNLSPHHVSLLIKYRCLHAQNRLETIKHCILCITANIQHKAIHHYLVHCTHGAAVAKNPQRYRALAKNDKAAWDTLDASSISNLCAHPQNREFLLSLALDTLNHCNIFDPE